MHFLWVAVVLAIKSFALISQADERVHTLGDLRGGPLAHRSGQWGIIFDAGAPVPDLRDDGFDPKRDWYSYLLLAVGGPWSPSRGIWDLEAELAHYPKIDNGGYYDLHAGLKVSPCPWYECRGWLLGLRVNFDALLDFMVPRDSISPTDTADSVSRENRIGADGSLEAAYKSYRGGIYFGARATYLFSDFAVSGKLGLNWQIHNATWLALRTWNLHAHYRYRATTDPAAEAHHVSVAFRFIWREHCSRFSWHLGPSLEIDNDVLGRTGVGGILGAGISYINSEFACKEDTPGLLLSSSLSTR